jgi:hypothetical protein
MVVSAGGFDVRLRVVADGWLCYTLAVRAFSPAGNAISWFIPVNMKHMMTEPHDGLITSEIVWGGIAGY